MLACWLAFAATASAAPVFASPVDLSAAGQDATQPRIAVDPSGNALAVWDRFNGSNETVQSAFRPAGGAFGAPVDLSVSGERAADPEVAFDSSGDALAVWRRSNGTNFIAQAAFRPAGGSFGAPVDLSAPGEDASVPEVSFDGSGNALAVWDRSNGTNDIVQSAFRPAGGAFGAPIDLSAPGENASTPQVAFDPSGNALAVWYRSNGTNFIVQGASRPAGGSFGAPVDLSSTGQNAYSPLVAFDPSGNALVVWDHSDGTNYVVQSVFRPSGGAFGAPVDLSASGQDAYAPEVAFDGSGNALAMWDRSNGTNEIVQSAFRPAGSAFGAPVDVSAAGQDAYSPQVAFDASGNALAVWQRSNGTNDIVQSAFRPAGGSFGTAVDLSGAGQDASTPQVALDPAGDPLAVWDRSNGTNTIVQAAVQGHTLSVSLAGTGAGRVSAAGINCPGTCSHTYPEGTTVTLSATPAAGSTFTGWSGSGCSGTGGCTVTMNADHSVTATFSPTPAATPPPTLGTVRQSARVWRESRALAQITVAKTRRRAPVGTTFSFTLNEPARVSFTFIQQLTGRKVNGRCVAPSAKNRHSHSCRRAVTRGTLTLAAHRGRDKVRFAGRISRSRKLGLGRYTVQIRATNAHGTHSRLRSLGFTIVK